MAVLVGNQGWQRDGPGMVRRGRRRQRGGHETKALGWRGSKGTACTARREARTGTIGGRRRPRERRSESFIVQSGWRWPFRRQRQQRTGSR